MARKYKVIAGSCPGNTKIYNYNDVVSAGDVDNAEERVKAGFLVEIEADVPATPATEEGSSGAEAGSAAPEDKGENKAEPTNEPAATGGEPAGADSGAASNVGGEPTEPANAPDYAAMTKAQLMEVLDAKGIAYAVSSTKEQLLAKLA